MIPKFWEFQWENTILYVGISMEESTVGVLDL